MRGPQNRGFPAQPLSGPLLSEGFRSNAAGQAPRIARPNGPNSAAANFAYRLCGSDREGLRPLLSLRLDVARGALVSVWLSDGLG